MSNDVAAPTGKVAADVSAACIQLIAASGSQLDPFARQVSLLGIGLRG